MHAQISLSLGTLNPLDSYEFGIRARVHMSSGARSFVEFFGIGSGKLQSGMHEIGERKVGFEA